MAGRWVKARAWLSAEPAYALDGRRGQRGRLGRLGRAHPFLLDVAPVAAVALLGAPVAVAGDGSDPLRWLLAVALVVPLGWRRRAPEAMFAVMAAVGLLQWLTGERPVSDAAFLVALYSVSAHRSRRTAAAAFAVLELGVVMASLRWSPAGSWERSLLFLTAAAAAAALLGLTLRNRRAQLAALVDRAERLELERDQQAQIAAAAERTRIAREMHDIVAHSLAVIISLADGAGVKVRREPDRAAEAIAGVATVGRQALDETRRLLGVLRAGPAVTPYAPQPSVAQLDDLLEGMREAGMPVRMAVRGEALVLPAGLQLVAYRIVQEALTNVLKHAAAVGMVEVTLDYRGAALSVTVDDDGLTVGPGDTAGGAGHGLLGMRERAAVYGGWVEAGPLDRRGWRVRARLPLGVVTAEVPVP